MIKLMRKMMILALPALLAAHANAEEIRLSGGAAAVTAVFSPIKESFEKSTGDTLKIHLTDPTRAMIALEKGEADFTTLNELAIDSAIKNAKSKGVEIDPKSLTRTLIAQTNLVVFLDRGNKVSKLSKEQLKAIFTGKIRNWKEMGGEDQPIVVLWGEETPFLNSLFSKRVMDGEAVTKEAKLVGDHFELRKLVIGTPGAICLGTTGLMTPKLKVPEVPSIALPILVITKGRPSPKVQKVMQFYQEEFGFMD